MKTFHFSFQACMVHRKSNASEGSRFVAASDTFHTSYDLIFAFLACLFLAALFPAPLWAATSIAEQAKAPSWIKPPDFMYSPAGKPDPFHPIIQPTRTKPDTPVRPEKSLTPLERIQPSQVELVGILSQSNGQRQALVELPNGKGFILEVGTSIGRHQGKITAITATTVVIQEKRINAFGKNVVQDTILKLHSQGEQPNG
jgi:type IV pilus assembly protein PilP